MVTSPSLLNTRINIPALSVLSQINQTNHAMGINIERLSSGLRINRADDDVGGFSLSRRLNTQVRALTRASQNVQDALAVSTIADNAMTEFISTLQSIRESAQEASSSTTTLSERLSLQNEIEDLMSELERIANTTSYGNKKLLNGSIGSTTEFVDNISGRLGASVGFGPETSSLLDGRSFLNIVQTQTGREELRAGSTAGMQIGLQQQTDIATTIAQFIEPVGAVLAADADRLRDLTFNRASLANNDVFSISGVLADGTTSFTGSISTDTGPGGLRLNNGAGSFVDQLQQIIDAAETNAGIEGTGILETTVDYNSATGRLEFTTDQGTAVSQFSVDFTVADNTTAQKTTAGTARTNTFVGEEITSTNTARIGNSFTAVTGSTFDTGEFEIEVQAVTAAQERTITTGYVFGDFSTGTTASLGTLLTDATFNGATIAVGANVIEINGTNADGTTFTTTFNVVGAADGVVGNNDVGDLQDLIDELNYRNETAGSYGFNASTSTLTATGTLQVIDDIATTNSSTAFTITVNATSTVVDSGTTTYEGNAEQALVSIDHAVRPRPLKRVRW